MSAPRSATTTQRVPAGGHPTARRLWAHRADSRTRPWRGREPPWGALFRLPARALARETAGRAGPTAAKRAVWRPGRGRRRARRRPPASGAARPGSWPCPAPPDPGPPGAQRPRASSVPWCPRPAGRCRERAIAGRQAGDEGLAAHPAWSARGPAAGRPLCWRRTGPGLGAEYSPQAPRAHPAASRTARRLRRTSPRDTAPKCVCAHWWGAPKCVEMLMPASYRQRQKKALTGLASAFLSFG